MGLTRAVLLTCLILLVVSAGATGVVAAQDECPNEQTDEEAGIVDSVTPDFLSDLFSALPVPDFVKGLFGAEC